MQNKIDVSPETYAMEMQALSDFYRNRTLVHAQQLADMTKGFHETADMVATLREQIEATPKPDPLEQSNRELANLLRSFVDDGVIALPAVEKLVRDAKNTMLRGSE